ncbi:MAG: hypothetical protein ACI81R_000717 [Bradymonadia bacterium]|jgi:hypothetical protein
MKKFLSVAAVLVLSFSAQSSFAQNDEGDVETRFYDFNDMLIDGELQRPTGVSMTERGSARFDSLLNLEQSFIEEIDQDAEESALE